MAGDLFISGLASGLDTSSIISQLMSIERRPQLRLKQKQIVEEARQQALRDVKTRLQNLSSSIAGLRDAITWADTQAVESSDTTKLLAVRTGGAAPGAYAVTVSALAAADQIRQGTGGATSASAAGTIDITVGGTLRSVSIAAGDNIDAIVGKINSTTDIHVYATNVGGRLYLSGKETGATKTISVASNALTDELKLSDATRAPSDHTITAQDASLTVNGNAVTSSSNTLTTAIPGVTLTLKSTIPVASPVTITVGGPAPDVDAIEDKVQAFVDQYNSTVEFIRGKLNEKKIAVPKSEADLAKGVLNSDSGLESVLTNLRNAIADELVPAPGSGAYARLSDIGVSTGATVGSGALSQDAIAGKLTLDVTKLSDALNNKFSDVKLLFNNATGSYASEGLSQRLDGIVSPQIQGDGTNAAILDSRIDAEQSAIDTLVDLQSDWDRRLAQKEKSLRTEFAKLESLLSQFQTTSSWLSGTLNQIQITGAQ